MKKEVLCVAIEDWGGIARLPRLLRLADCHVTAMARPGTLLSKTRYANEQIVAPTTAAEALDELKRHLEKRGRPYDWIILGDDGLVMEAAKRISEPWVRDWFHGSSTGDIPMALASKDVFIRRMAVAGVATPPSEEVRDKAQLRTGVARLGFPALVKPAFGWGGRGIHRLRSSQELEELTLEPGDYLVQRFLDGRVGCTLVLFSSGRPAWWISAFNINVWPQFQNVCQRDFVELPEVVPMIEKIGGALGLHCFAEVEWIRDDAGRLTVIELNSRPAPTHFSCGDGAELELAAAVRNMLDGRAPAPHVPTMPFSLFAFPDDFVRAVKTRQWAHCARWMLGQARPTDIPWSDPLLLLRTWWSMIKWLLRDTALVRRIRRH